MTCEFGYNCRHYLPTLRKCRKLIDNYRTRPDLVGEKWLRTADVLVYLNLTSDELTKLVASGEIKVKRQTDGKLTFSVSGAWQYDDCHLADSGGGCLHYAGHDGPKISCIEDLKQFDAEHPNKQRLPSESDIKMLENEINEIMAARISAV